MKKRILIPLMAGLALLWACKGKSKAEYEVVNNSSSADSAKIDSVSTTKTKLVKTADINFKVKNAQQTAERVSALTVSCNGMVIHHQMISTTERSLDVRISNDSVMKVTCFNTIAEMTVKVPQGKLEEFVNKVAAMGIYINKLNLDITDKSLDYLSSQLKLKNRTELVAQQKKGEVIIKKPEDVLRLKDDMVDEQIGNLGVNNGVKSSVITLNFYQSNAVSKEIVANDDPSAYNLSFVKRLGLAIENGWEVFVDIAVGLANLSVFLLAGAGAWMAMRHYRNKKSAAMIKGAVL